MAGKWYAHQNSKQVIKAQNYLHKLKTKANAQSLSSQDLCLMETSTEILKKHDFDRAAKAHFLSRSHGFKDIDCVAKPFFSKLQASRNRTSLAKVVLEDGSTLTHPNELAAECVSHFGKILS